MSIFSNLFQKAKPLPGTLIAYAERTTTEADDTETSSWQDVKDMEVTFVGPSTGFVTVRLSGMSTVDAGVSGHGWGVREGENLLVSGDVNGNTAHLESHYVSIPFRIPVTPGVTKTLKWSHARGGNGNARIMSCWRFGGFGGPVAMEVTIALP